MTNTASKEGAQSVVTIKRPWRSRVSTPHLLMIVVGTAAFLGNLAVLRSQEEVATIAVAAVDLTPGLALDSSRHVAYVEVPSSSALLDSGIAEAEIGAFDGLILSVPLAQGDLISRSGLLLPAAGDGLRAMSVPIDPSNAAGGRIRVGDLVDVIAVEEGRAYYVLSGAEVIDRSDQSQGGSITGARAFFLVLAVDDSQALELASAMDRSSIQVVRSTGARPLTNAHYESTIDPAPGAGR